MASTSTALDEVVAIAREAGELAASFHGGIFSVEHKGSPLEHDVVTEVDHAVEQLVVDRIAETAPGAAVLAEERGVVLASGEAAAASDVGDHDDLWVIDPIDGTINFANHLPGFAVSVGRYSMGRPVAGAIYDPLLDEMYTFESQDGVPARAMLDGVPITASSKRDLSSCVVGVGTDRLDLFPQVASQCRSWRRLGAATLNLAYTACGRLDAYVNPATLAPWDHAVGAPLVLAAGGVVTNLDGAPWHYPLDSWSGIVAASPTVHPLVWQTKAGS